MHSAVRPPSFWSLNTFAFAQGTADIVGRVTDTSGGVLPAVTVTAENMATKNVRTTVTSDTGDYLFTLLPIGVYTVKIELQGFQSVSSRSRRSPAATARALTRGCSRQPAGDPPRHRRIAAAADRPVDAQLARQREGGAGPAGSPAATSCGWCSWCPARAKACANSLANGTRPDDRRSDLVGVDQRRERQPEQPDDRRHGQQRARHRHGRHQAVDGRHRGSPRPDQPLSRPKPAAPAGGIINILTKSGTNAFHGSGLRVPPQRTFDSTSATTSRPTNRSSTRTSSAAAFGGPHRLEPDVLLRRLRAASTERQGCRRQPHAADGEDADRRLLGAAGDCPIQITTPRRVRARRFPGNIIPASRSSRSRCTTCQLYPPPNSPRPRRTTIWRRRLSGRRTNHTMDGRIDHRFNIRTTRCSRATRYNNLDYLHPRRLPAGRHRWTFAGDQRCSSAARQPAASRGRTKTAAHAFQANYVRVFSSTLIGEFKGSYVATDLALACRPNYQTNAGRSSRHSRTRTPRDEANGQGLNTITLTGYIRRWAMPATCR